MSYPILVDERFWNLRAFKYMEENPSPVREAIQCQLKDLAPEFLKLKSTAAADISSRGNFLGL